MSTLLYTGSTGYRELTPKYEKRDGVWTTTRRWRGLKGELLDLANTLGDPSATLEQEDEFWWLLSSSQPGRVDDPDSAPPSLDSQVVTLWGLAVSKLTKSIWELPKVKAQIDLLWGKDGLTEEERQGIAVFRADLLALARGESVSYQTPVDAEAGDEVQPQSIKITLKAVLDAVSPPTDRKVWSDLFQDLASGVESYTLDHFVLRKRSVAPWGASLGPTLENTNRAIRTSTLKGLETITPSINAVLPDGYWFRGGTELNETDATRFEIVTDWTFVEDYSRFIYGEPL